MKTRRAGRKRARRAISLLLLPSFHRARGKLFFRERESRTVRNKRFRPFDGRYIHIASKEESKKRLELFFRIGGSCLKSGSGLAEGRRSAMEFGECGGDGLEYCG